MKWDASFCLLTSKIKDDCLKKIIHNNLTLSSLNTSYVLCKNRKFYRHYNFIKKWPSFANSQFHEFKVQWRFSGSSDLKSHMAAENTRQVQHYYTYRDRVGSVREPALNLNWSSSDLSFSISSASCDWKKQSGEM